VVELLATKKQSLRKYHRKKKQKERSALSIDWGARQGLERKGDTKQEARRL
jgi:hypothetical protein